MDEHGVITASANHEIGNALPFDVWHGRTLRFSCPNDVKGSNLIEYLNSDDAKLKFQRIHDMHSIEWDGNKNVGRFTNIDEFLSLKEEIQSELQSID